MEDYSRTKSNSQRTTFFNRYSSISSSSSTRSPPDAATRSTSPTRVTLGRSVSPSPSVRFSAPKPLQSRKSINQSHQIHQSPKIKSKKTCMCSPTTHPGSFRCSLHKGSLVPGYNIGNRTSSYRSGVQLNMRRSAMTNSLVRIGTVEGELVKRALAALIRPSLHNLRRRGEFQPRPSRLSVMSKAEDEMLGIRSLILESADTLRTEGYALAIWTNAWKALDAVGVGKTLRAKHNKLSRGDREVWRINRSVLVETLKGELPQDTIRYSSRVVQILNSGFFKLIHLADGTVLKTKLLIGCDGVNSMVTKFLGFSKPSLAGRGSVRGYVKFKDGHGFESEFLQFFGNGVRYGVTPCDDHGVYWFFTYIPSPQDEGIGQDRIKMKQFVLSKLGNVSNKVRSVFDKTDMASMTWSQLKYRHPWELLWGNVSKDNVCIAGDALHPMTPDIGQGGCSALEDGVVLVRAIAKALSGYSGQENVQEEEQQRIKVGLEKYAKERRWRSMKLVSVAYLVGYIQQSNGAV